MKPWKPCEHCYLKDKHCENAEREQPCVPVQEYLESSSKIKRLQILLGMYEKKYYKTLQQLAIATKALEEYATNESYKLCVVYCHYGEPVHASDVAIQALKEMEGE